MHRIIFFVFFIVLKAALALDVTLSTDHFLLSSMSGMVVNSADVFASSGDSIVVLSRLLMTLFEVVDLALAMNFAPLSVA